MAAIAPVAAERGSAAPHCTAHLHAFSRLVDGTDIVIRPVHPGDDALERAFIAGLSRDSRYNRLLSGRSLTQAEIRQLTRINYAREMAFVALSRNGGLHACWAMRVMSETRTAAAPNSR